MGPDIDRYAAASSIFHNWDPRWKLFSFFVFMLCVGLLPVHKTSAWRADTPPIVAATVLAVGFVWMSRIPLVAAIRSVVFLVPFALAVVIVFALTGPQSPDDSSRWYSSVGLAVGVLVSLRVVAVTLLIFPALGTTRFVVTLQALRALRVPVPIVQMIRFSYRYLFVHRDQYCRVRRAMTMRGFVPRLDRTTGRRLGHLVGGLLVSSFERTERIHSAMLCRGFDGTFPETTNFRTRRRDVLLASALIACGLGLLAWRFA